jgi:hypothetical protein
VISGHSFHSKNWACTCFYFSLPNKTSGKTFDALSKKNVTLKIVTNITLLINFSDLTLHKVKVMAKVAYQDSQKIKIVK